MAERIHGQDCRRQGRSKIPEGPCTHGDRDFVRTRTLDGGWLARHRRHQREGGVPTKAAEIALGPLGCGRRPPQANLFLTFYRRNLKPAIQKAYTTLAIARQILGDLTGTLPLQPRAP